MTPRLRHRAAVNPPTPEFDLLTAATDVTFVPLEAVWREGLDTSRSRPRSEVGIGYTRFRDGDIVVPKITPTFQADRSTIAANSLNGVFAGTTELHVVRSTAGLDPRYARYLFSSRPFLVGGEAELIGVAGQKRVPDDWLKNFVVPVDDVQAQRAIADYLDAATFRIDSLVVRKRRLIELVVERAESALEELFAHWKQIPVRRLARRIDVGIAEATTHAYADAGVPLIRSTNIRRNRLDVSDLLHIEPWFAERNRSKYLNAGDILTVRTGDTGVSAVVPPELHHSQCFTQLITTLKPGQLPDLICAALNSGAARRFFEQAGWGSAQANISVPLLAGAPVPDIPSHEQVSVLRDVRRILHMTERLPHQLAKQINLLGEHRQALITVAVTGQLTVLGDAA